ncbi:MAG: crossover junction endodeoxyribonuclease RuvC [Candidatus Buchananbacteria bacterium RIFCSPHIGHO2_02_FULL_40_13]|uniref:Crossover junction endodeoxyribonuclease RuvC n=1 Tax=Candidatus Buchananbacteria bacterium RIFCSPLOWO2_01_FULL_39_33 TaxID=1797543 RepID=A0A1G1YGQ9_9BACT|nr:MAG: crossover junction endodeoxyribonuclease RuvC [Candidatus Buchananbacteria bacterium RIFCSPHIGHO2_01_FULL_40_35]OGY49048.1 MAG: crossover junction endodeoxyribonuclease RuvC [Candidatus Buchananbacteria bacterium RIFCSPHIGHO2_02_FULL_40_13]OGY51489.1 MAG: crossover junction endodeoxyribonuclease RuvC [Candidatus Buchananbacteria bacterium RIFCSPLOWO2_01_FULL_39_33]
MPTGKLKKNIILGIDPGLADTGFGLIAVNGQELTCLDHGSITTDKKLSLPARLQQLEQKLILIINKYKPNFMSLEQLFFCTNTKTIIAVGEARGVILLTAAKYKLPVKEFTPLQVKQGITGYGQADKKQVQRMVKTILKLKTLPEPDDAADALAIAICAINK